MEYVAYRVVAANLVPDRSTIAGFRVRHEQALAEVFTGVLGLCGGAGLVSVGVVAIDGTKVHPHASRAANLTYEQSPSSRRSASRRCRAITPRPRSNEHQIVVAAEATVEPAFAQMKFNRCLDRFKRRGRAASRSQWRLFGATHNLLKLHNHRIAAAGA